MERHKSEKNKDIFSKILLALGGLLLLLVLVNTSLSIYSVISIDGRIADMKEAARPARIELTIVEPLDCPDCAPVDSYIEQIKALKVNVTRQRTVLLGDSSIPALSKVPAILIKGETNKTPELSTFFSGASFGSKSGFVTLEGPATPYFDINSGTTKGLVTAIAIEEPSCKNCTPSKAILASMALMGVKMSSSRTIALNSSEGLVLASKYSFGKLPAIILSPDIYDYIGLESLGERMSDGSMLVEPVEPIYYDLAKRRAVGEVSLVFLNDSSCGSCYSVDSHLAILPRYGLAPASVSYVDVSSAEGKALVSKYSITKVPTFLLSEDASIYASLASVWKSVGTTESDGRMVFRNVEVMGAYKDLSTGQVVEPSS